MQSAILVDKPSVALEIFLRRYSRINAIDVDRARDIIRHGIRNPEGPDGSGYLNGLCRRWYSSVDAGKPDYDIYDDDYYFTDLWKCWVIYSRGYIRGILKGRIKGSNLPISSLFNGVTSVADLGCGIGYTTAALAELFPRARVYGTNIPATQQWAFAADMAERYGFDLLPQYNSIPTPVDLVVASEYFEHFVDAPGEVDRTIQRLQPKMLYAANSFATYSLGHFMMHQDMDDQLLDKRSVGKRFTEVLKGHGYTKRATTLWNNKPGLWVRQRDVQ